MKHLILLTALAFPVGIFAQGPNTNANPPAQVQSQNINYYDQLLSNDDNIIQTNVTNQQRTGSGSSFGSNNTNTTPCTDCDKVKKAIKLSHASSGSQKRSFSMKKWFRTTEGKLNMKLRKTCARKHKVRSNYALCFNWH